MEDNKPIYDDRVKFVMAEMIKGRSREDIAEELEYANYRSLDIYMRRKFFRYCNQKDRYEPVVEEVEDTHMPSSSRVMEIISLLSKEDNDPKTVAKRVGFQDHLEMAEFLSLKGYVYDGDKRNYVKKLGIVEKEQEGQEDQKDLKNSKGSLSNVNDSNLAKVNGSLTLDGSLDQYLPILDILANNKDRLIDLLMPEVGVGEIPRYVVNSSSFVTKSVHMSDKLDKVVRSFSSEKGINQRQIFEVALINFFKLYGYEAEVKMLLEN